MCGVSTDRQGVPKQGQWPGPSHSPWRVSFCCLTDDIMAWCGRAAPGLCGDHYWWLMAAEQCGAMVVPRCCGSVEQLLGGSAWCLLATPVTAF